MYKTICLYRELPDNLQTTAIGCSTAANLLRRHMVSVAPHIYTLNTEKEPTNTELDNLLWQMVEIENLADGQCVFVEELTIKNEDKAQLVEVLTYAVQLHIRRTKSPSNFILQDKKPIIFEIDRKNSYYTVAREREMLS